MYENPYQTSGVPDSPTPKRRWWPTVLVFAIPLGFVGLLLLPAHRGVNLKAQQKACYQNLSRIAEALQNYKSAKGKFPPPFTVDADGKPLHSWRTLLLPYLGENELYKKIDVEKPWDDPVNDEARHTLVWQYTCPSENGHFGGTTYLACLTADGKWLAAPPDRPVVMLIEAPYDQSVEWMSPRDANAETILSVNWESNLAHRVTFHVVMSDGSIVDVSYEMSLDDRRALLNGQPANP